MLIMRYFIIFASYHSLTQHFSASIFSHSSDFSYTLSEIYTEKFKRLHNSQYKQKKKKEKISGMMSRARSLDYPSSLIHFFADIAAIKFSIFAISSRLFVVDATL